MSAFAGLVNLDGAPVDSGHLQRLGAALPRLDGRAFTASRSGPAGFVHRAYPITPEDRLERQPWSGADGRHHLVFAGSLDNRAALAEALGITGPDLAQMADGLLCLRAAERWGGAAPEHLQGRFAYGYWDEPAQRLQLCRGRSNARPIFLHRGRDFLAFASSPTTLFALPQIPRELDLTIAGDLLVMNFHEARRTVYRGIERLPSGCLAVCERGRIEVQEYWTPQRRALGFTRHEDYVEAARDMLDRCVASALRSETPVAVAASGGLDSSGITAAAARQLAPRRLAVYTRVPPPGFSRAEGSRTYFDERPKVAALARMHPNMDVTWVDAAAPHAFDSEPGRAAACFAMPTPNSVNMGWFAALYDKVGAGGHRVLLDGAWGNTSLGWSAPRRLEAMLRDDGFAPAASEAAAYRRATGRSLLAILAHNVLSPLEPKAVRRLRRRLTGRGLGAAHNAFIAPDFLREHDIAGRLAAFGSRRDDGRDPFERRARKLVRGNEVAQDWIAAAIDVFGFEIRSPLIDPRLIEFCLNIPEEHFQRGGRPRALQRDVIAGRVPREIADNYKLGAQAPEWFGRIDPLRAQIASDIERFAHSPAASALIDIERLRRAAENWPANAADAERRATELRRGMMRAVAMGRFLCWFEGGNA